MLGQVLRNSVCFCFYDAVAYLNIGSKAAISIMNELGMVPGQYFLEGMKESDKERMAKGNFKSKGGTNKRRKVLRGQNKVTGDQTKEKEGTTYKAGVF